MRMIFAGIAVLILVGAGAQCSIVETYKGSDRYLTNAVTEIVAGDGAVWFGMLRSGGLGRLMDSRVEMFKLPREGARPCSLAVDRGGNVWYADISGYVGMLPMRYARRRSG